MLTRALLASCLLLAACGGGLPTYPSVAIGPIGPFPAGVIGKVAFSTNDLRSIEGGGLFETHVHVIDVARGTDRVIFTRQSRGLQVLVDGLSWAPDGEHLVMQLFSDQPYGPNGENRSIRELHRLSLAGDDRVIFDELGPEWGPAYSTDGRLAYFGGWDSDPAAGIFIDGSPARALRSRNNNSYLAWVPDGSSLVYTEQASGLWRLSLANGIVTQLVVPENGDVIVHPAVSPDGTRIALMRYGGSRQDEEIWTVAATGSDGKELTSGCGASFPSWVPGGAYVAFHGSCRASEGIYVVPQAGGTPIRVVGISGGLGAMAWSR